MQHILSDGYSLFGPLAKLLPVSSKGTLSEPKNSLEHNPKIYFQIYLSMLGRIMCCYSTFLLSYQNSKIFFNDHVK